MLHASHVFNRIAAELRPADDEPDLTLYWCPTCEDETTRPEWAEPPRCETCCEVMEEA